MQSLCLLLFKKHHYIQDVMRLDESATRAPCIRVTLLQYDVV